MRKLLFLSILLLLVSSCSKSDPFLDDDKQEPNSKFVTLGLAVSKKEAMTFENLEFRFTTDRPITFGDIQESYDSLTWYVPELNSRLQLMEYTNHSSQFTFSWGHSFYNEGRYQTILRGVKNGKTVLSDTLYVQINDRSDFLGKNWKDVTYSDWGSIGSANAFDAEYMIFFRQDYQLDFPSLYVTFLPNQKADQKEYYEQKQERLIFDYISGVYGNALWSVDKDSDTIINTFHKLFKQGKKSFEPRYIWVTKTTNIALVEELDGSEKCANYFIYAEPNNQTR